MSFTSDDTFGDKIRPFSEDFNAAMRGVAADLSNLNTYLPIINELILRDNPGGLPPAGIATFPALITAEAEIANGRYLYTVSEVSYLSSEDQNTPPSGVGRQGSAFNVAEYSGAEGYKGTGIPQECLSNIITQGSSVQVLSMVGQIVMASVYNPVNQPPAPDNEQEDGPVNVVPQYVFHCWVPYCVSCGNPDGVLLNDQERIASTGLDPYNVSFPPDVETIEGRSPQVDRLDSGSEY